MALAWTTVTDLGDTAVTLPLAALVLAFLVAVSWLRAAFAWALCIGFCGLALGVLKLVFQSCGHVWFPALQSPSGHTAMSVAVYGGLALVAGRPLSLLPRAALLAVGAALPAAIAVSRLVLGYHSLPEVLMGAAFGVLAVASLHRNLAASPPPRPLPLIWLMPLAALMVAATYGSHWQVEETIRQVAALLGRSIPGCVALN